MKWYREISKWFLNAALLTLAVFIYGFATNPQWTWKYLAAGALILALCFYLSRKYWDKGGSDG